MKGSALNLASEPFTNLRPQRRAATTLALLAVALLTVNAVIYRQYLVGSAETRERLREMEMRISEERAAIAELHGQLRGPVLEQQNDEVRFLNQRIAQRTFPWSRLFDRLSEALPAEVRLHSLSPQNQSDRNRRRVDGRVELRISGSARSDEALFAFVDGLFRHPSFAEPKLIGERQEMGLVDFELVTSYVAETVAPPSLTELADASSAPEGPAATDGAGERTGSPAAGERIANESVAEGAVPGGESERSPAGDVRRPPRSAPPASPAPPAVVGRRDTEPASAGSVGRAAAPRPALAGGRAAAGGGQAVPTAAPRDDSGGGRREPIGRPPPASGPPSLRPGGRGR